ncbi:MAG: restriction endonuclease subunit S [Pseudanabaena sp.]|jgi:type I restriction enzyme S subunit
MNNWITIPFEDLYVEPSRNGLNRPKRVRGNGYRMVNMGELFACDRIRDLEMDLVPMNEAEKEKYSLEQGDLLFARQSLVAEGAGKCSIILETPQLTTFESHLIRVRLNKNKANPLFYYYYFVSPYGKINVQSLVMQVAAAGIRGSELARLRIPFPPLATQSKIASIISAYDDLIENNTRRIKILEEMAQMLYREWFINFRFPKHENIKMVESELGLIPEGWEVKKVGDIAQEVRRGVNPNLVDPETPYFGLEHLPRKSIALSDWGKAGDIQSTKLAFKKGEILFGKIRPYFHKVGVAPVDGICSSDAIVIQPKNSKYFASVLSCVSSEDFVNHATQTSQGTKMPRANWDVLTKYPVVLPTSNLLNQFNEFINNAVQEIQNLVLKNINLRKTRDLLLPKLISGEIEVENLDIETLEIAA